MDMLHRVVFGGWALGIVWIAWVSQSFNHVYLLQSIICYEGHVFNTSSCWMDGPGI
jgi:hypothetical protein